jgi:hypothetical protein
MVNQEVLGGLVSALSRGESLHNAMFSLFNAGYKKSDIEDAARMLQSQTPVQISQNAVVEKKMELKKNIQEKAAQQKTPEKIKEGVAKQNVSKYGEKKSPGKFENVLDETIKNLQKVKTVEVVKPDNDFRPPIIIQRISDYNAKNEKPASKAAIIILVFLLIILIGALAGLFIFRDKIIEIFNSINF